MAHHAQAIADFTLPPSVKIFFESHHHHCFSEPCPDFTKGWGTESPNWKWQRLHNESILGSAQSATAAVFYHCENMLRMEREVLSFRDIDLLIPLMGKSAMGGGNTQKLDFEYHAFIFLISKMLQPSEAKHRNAARWQSRPQASASVTCPAGIVG